MRNVHCLVIALFLFTVTCTLSPAFAEDSTTSARKDLLRPKIDTRRELTAQLIDSRQEKIATRAAALRLKLASFRDKTKASASARINDNLARVNQNRTGQMLQHLTRLSEILSKIEIRVNALPPEVDTNSVDASILTAKAAIDTAKAAVTAQSEKDYTIIISTEAKVKEDATRERQLLHSDLKSVHDLVAAAKQAVFTVLRQAVQLGGGSNGK